MCYFALLPSLALSISVAQFLVNVLVSSSSCCYEFFFLVSLTLFFFAIIMAWRFSHGISFVGVYVCWSVGWSLLLPQLLRCAVSVALSLWLLLCCCFSFSFWIQILTFKCFSFGWLSSWNDERNGLSLCDHAVDRFNSPLYTHNNTTCAMCIGCFHLRKQFCLKFLRTCCDFVCGTIWRFYYFFSLSRSLVFISLSTRLYSFALFALLRSLISKRFECYVWPKCFSVIYIVSSSFLFFFGKMTWKLRFGKQQWLLKIECIYFVVSRRNLDQQQNIKPKVDFRSTWALGGKFSK